MAQTAPFIKNNRIIWPQFIAVADGGRSDVVCARRTDPLLEAFVQAPLTTHTNGNRVAPAG